MGLYRFLAVSFLPIYSSCTCVNSFPASVPTGLLLPAKFLLSNEPIKLLVKTIVCIIKLGNCFSHFTITIDCYWLLVCVQYDSV